MFALIAKLISSLFSLAMLLIASGALYGWLSGELAGECAVSGAKCWAASIGVTAMCFVFPLLILIRLMAFVLYKHRGYKLAHYDGQLLCDSTVSSCFGRSFQLARQMASELRGLRAFRLYAAAAITLRILAIALSILAFALFAVAVVSD